MAAVGAVVALRTNAISDLQLRQEQDPRGGYRGDIWAVAMEQIKSSPWVGTGPNSYSEVVGRHDPLAAHGFPVHNSFLYPIAEVGIPLALIFFSPLLLTLFNSLKNTLKNKSLDLRTAALISILPGLIIIGWTGWGLGNSDALPLWFMAFGFLNIGDSARTDQSGDRSGTDSRRKISTP